MWGKIYISGRETKTLNAKSFFFYKRKGFAREKLGWVNMAAKVIMVTKRPWRQIRGSGVTEVKRMLEKRSFIEMLPSHHFTCKAVVMIWLRREERMSRRLLLTTPASFAAAAGSRCLPRPLVPIPPAEARTRPLIDCSSLFTSWSSSLYLELILFKNGIMDLISLFSSSSLSSLLLTSLYLQYFFAKLWPESITNKVFFSNLSISNDYL